MIPKYLGDNYDLDYSYNSLYQIREMNIITLFGAFDIKKCFALVISGSFRLSLLYALDKKNSDLR